MHDEYGGCRRSVCRGGELPDTPSDVIHVTQRDEDGDIEYDLIQWDSVEDGLWIMADGDSVRNLAGMV